MKLIIVVTLFALVAVFLFYTDDKIRRDVRRDAKRTKFITIRLARWVWNLSPKQVLILIPLGIVLAIWTPYEAYKEGLISERWAYAVAGIATLIFLVCEAILFRVAFPHTRETTTFHIPPPTPEPPREPTIEERIEELLKQNRR